MSRIPDHVQNELHLDHCDEDYLHDGETLLIECHGHYSVAELKAKIRLLLEADASLVQYGWISGPVR